MIRVTRRIIRFFGWLLTPLVAWAAAFFGGWIGARLFVNSDSAKVSAVGMFVTAGVFAFAATFAWAWAIRRSARLQVWGRRQLRGGDRKASQ